jgi:hypothetical protein
MGNLYKDVPSLIFGNHEYKKDAPILISNKDSKILRELGKKYSEIAMKPINDTRKKMWTKLNDLDPVKPMIWINEICWNEMDFNNELVLETENIFCQKIEIQLRRVIYQWNHMQGDMVVEPIIYSPLSIRNSGIGLEEDADYAITEKDNDVVSRHFNIQINNKEDIEKITIPEISCNNKKSKEIFQAYQNLFEGILKVKKRGIPGFWFAPWDDIIAWTGIQEGLTDLALRPDYIHKLISKLVDVYINILEQYEKITLLASNNNNTRIGSGAYGYTTELPKEDFTNNHVKTCDIWGSSTAQIFAGVSNKMHDEFGIEYEKKWLERFGLSYYGCCEPLDKKINILSKISNLRKISISPWSDIENAAKNIGRKYVISLKPNPATLAVENWNPELAREELDQKLASLKGCNIEIVMKDISTVRHEPNRLWEWAKIAVDVSQKYA